ncbi:MAG: DMT family transporter [Comamonas sp.]
MDDKSNGWLYGLIGVAIFSGSLPATRLAVADFDPAFLTALRAVIAGALAGLILLARRPGLPRAADWPGLALGAAGVVLAFPMLTALALQHITAARSIVFIGLLPLATAIFGVWRGGERPRPAFWLFALAGGLCVALFAARHDTGTDAAAHAQRWLGDTLMLAAVMACGYGYAEGARLSRRLGGWQVICWMLVLFLPVMLGWSLLASPPDWTAVRLSAWAGLAYVSLLSMLIGFFFWYRGLALGGIAAVGQLQLLQPFLGLLLAAALLGEAISWGMALTALAVVACVAGARRSAAR